FQLGAQRQPLFFGLFEIGAVARLVLAQRNQPLGSAVVDLRVGKLGFDLSDFHLQTADLGFCILNGRFERREFLPAGGGLLFAQLPLTLAAAVAALLGGGDAALVAVE